MIGQETKPQHAVQPSIPKRKKPIVITIHGVNPDRSWQPKIHRVLRPHFDPIPYQYADYDTLLGPIRAVVNIPTFLLALSLIIGPLTLGGSWPVALVVGLGVVLIFVSGLLAWLRRSKCAKELKLAIDRELPIGRAHLIAHSLGTYLIGRLLRKFPDVRLENVILVSTVLPRNYPWRSILGEMPPKVRKVRSEYGKSDFVVRAVGWISWLVRDLGNAGLYGFFDLQNWVHTLSSPSQGCLYCYGRDVPAPVHNVPLVEFGHSDQFLSSKHAQMLWLPYVWKMTINAANNYWRANQRSLAGQDLFWELDPSDYLAEPSINADDYLILKEAVGLVQGKLDSQDSKLLNLLLAGRSLGQAAKDLGISYSNAAVRLHRAKSTIRKLLISND